MTRISRFAGSWYSSDKLELTKNIESYFQNPKFGPGEFIVHETNKTRTIFGGIIPHAGYIYSASAAAHTLTALFKEKCPDSVIILGNTHTGYSQIATMRKGFWETPFGKMEIDSELAEEIINSSQHVIDHERAFEGHHQEHNIEIQLPLLQFLAEKCQKDLKFVPIKVGNYQPSTLREVAHNIATIIKQSRKDIIVIASSDMTHESPREHGSVEATLQYMEKMNTIISNAVKKVDPELLFSEAIKLSICGPQTMYTLIHICLELGAKVGTPLKYYTSYDIQPSFMPSSIVGYLSAVFSSGGNV